MPGQPNGPTEHFSKVSSLCDKDEGLVQLQCDFKATSGEHGQKTRWSHDFRTCIPEGPTMRNTSILFTPKAFLRAVTQHQVTKVTKGQHVSWKSTTVAIHIYMHIMPGKL